MERAGIEEEAVRRLTSDINSSRTRTIIDECLRGNSSPSATLRALVDSGDLDGVRNVIDQVTHRAATISRAGDNLVRDRADELTQLFVEIESGCETGAQLINRLDTR